jgi:hypothetical protein
MIKAEIRRDPGIYFDFPSFSRKIGQVLSDQVARDTKPRMEQVVAGWKAKPSFKSDLKRKDEGWVLWVGPTGPVARIWAYLTKGVEGHYIRPRRKRVLRFQTGYRPRTHPGKPYYYQGPGRYVGHVRFSRGHYWPGIEPRNFEQKIIAEYKPSFLRTTVRGVISAIRGSRRG